MQACSSSVYSTFAFYSTLSLHIICVHMFSMICFRYNHSPYTHIYNEPLFTCDTYHVYTTRLYCFPVAHTLGYDFFYAFPFGAEEVVVEEDPGVTVDVVV